MEITRGIVAAVALGSNMGDRHAHIARALVALAGVPKSRFVVRSSMIETAPMPIEPAAVSAPAGAMTTASLGGPYLNAVALLKTTLDPRAMLETLLQIERTLGRVREPGHRAGPRTIDLDLLLHGSTEMKSPDLTLPHPRLHLRAFVLIPLAQIAPEMIVPGRGRTVRELRDGLGTPTRGNS